MILYILILAVIFVVLWVYSKLKIPAGVSSVPSPVSSRLIGHTGYIGQEGRTLHDWVRIWHREFGEIFRFDLPGNNIYFINNPEWMNKVFQKSNIRGHRFSRITAQTFGVEGLFMQEGPKWRKHRHIISPIFHSKSLERIAWIMLDCIEDFTYEIKSLIKEEYTKIDMYDMYCRLTLDVIGRSAFGFRFDSIKGKNLQIRDAVKTLMNECILRVNSPFESYRGLLEKVPFTPLSNIIEARKLIRDKVINVIQEKVDEKNKAGNLSRSQEVAMPDLLDILLEMQSEDSKDSLTVNELFDEIFTFLLAGAETTSNALTYLLGCIAKHPEVQQKIFEEISDIVGERNPEYADIPKLKYLSMCIKEAMRLYPSGASNRRELEEDLQLGDHLLPKGSSVMMSLFTVHFDERFWGTDAHLYKPERFQSDVASKRQFHSFSPFGGGLRICVGKTFAETELILSTIRLLQEFEFSWIDSIEWPIKIAQSFTVVPKDGLVVNIKKRH